LIGSDLFKTDSIRVLSSPLCFIASSDTVPLPRFSSIVILGSVTDCTLPTDDAIRQTTINGAFSGCASLLSSSNAGCASLGSPLFALLAGPLPTVPPAQRIIHAHCQMIMNAPQTADTIPCDFV
jgi:hypothetical protein